MRVQVIIPDQFRSAIEGAADSLGVTPAMWIRIAALNALNDAKPAHKDKPLSEKQKDQDRIAKIEARFGPGKTLSGVYYEPEGWHVWVDAKRKIRKPDSDATPFKGYETEEDLRRVVSYWIEHGGEYAHAKREYGERLLTLKVRDRADRLQLFDDIWNELAD